MNDQRMKGLLPLLAAMVLGACGVDSSASVDADDELFVEELDAAMHQELAATALNVVPQAIDVAPGATSGRVARLLTTPAAARALLGPVLPAMSFTRNWLIASRPEGVSSRARVEVTRAQLSTSGQTLSVWVTVTEPGPACPAWRPNQLAVARVPSRTLVPTAMRVYVTRVTADCGFTVGPSCQGSNTFVAPACTTPTPFCLGTYERPDGSYSVGTCVKLPTYEGTSASCTSDAACGARGICAGLSTSGEGLCQASWMRATASTPEGGALSAPVPRDGSWARLVVPVSGQATVPMEAWVQVFIDGATSASYRSLRVRVSNPSGTPSPEALVAPMGQPVVLLVPGDESVNGEWLVEVRDEGSPGDPVQLRGARLSVTSRWD